MHEMLPLNVVRKQSSREKKKASSLLHNSIAYYNQGPKYINYIPLYLQL